MSPSLPRRVLTRTRVLFVRGLLVVLPAAVTIWLVLLLFGAVNRAVSAVVVALVRLAGAEEALEGAGRFLLPALGFLTSLALLVLVGLLATNLLGRRLLAAVERLVLAVPFVRGIYGSAKQLLEAFTVGGKGAFREVVAFEYPRRGCWVIGFVASRTPPVPGVEGWEEEMLNLFVPTTPNPTSGFLFLVAAREVRHLPIPVEDGIKMVVSGGLVIPPGLLGRQAAGRQP